jgi:hypothetical protein
MQTVGYDGLQPGFGLGDGEGDGLGEGDGSERLTNFGLDFLSVEWSVLSGRLADLSDRVLG